jgi:ABC-type bacteriocin/lantibiotic exporter with double-glycine peptidase domain
MINIVSQSLKILNYNFKKSFFITLILILIGSFFEMFSIFLLFQLVKFFLNPLSYELVFFDYIIFEKDSISFDRNLISLLILVSIVFVTKVIYFLFLYKKQFSFTNNLTVSLSKKLLKKYLLADFNFHNNVNSSILIRNINTEVTQFTVGVIQQLLTFLTELFIILSIVVLLFLNEPFLTLISILVLSFVGLLYWIFTKNIFTFYGNLRQNLSGTAMKQVLESLNGIKDIKVYSAENFFLKNFEKTIKRFAETNTIVMIFQQVPKLGLELIVVLIMMLLVFFNMEYLAKNNILLQTIGLFAIASIKMIPSVTKILVALQNFRFNRPSIRVLSNELKNKDSVNTQNKKNQKFEFTKNIQLKDICYKYPKSEKYVLRNINLEIKKGQKIGLVGESGSGKSTLLNIIMGLIDPTSGQMCVDNKNISQFKSEWLANIGYVPQKIYLADDSIKSNIAFGLTDEEINISKIEKSTINANLKKFIDSLKDGYSARVGEFGNKISGGQAQRVGIARAYYKSSDVIILDEATNALDIDNEDKIIKIINKNEDSKTFIIVSHRESILRECNLIFSLVDGQITRI